MESFFFQADWDRFRERSLASGLNRIDVSNGLVYLDADSAVELAVPFDYRDRMVILAFVRQGAILFSSTDGSDPERVKAGEIGMFISRRQRGALRFEKAEGFVLFVADFFLKRYRSGEESAIIDRLYARLEDAPLERLATDPLDALSLHLIGKITQASPTEPMRALRGEHRVVELMLHRLGRLAPLSQGAEDELSHLAARARALLEADFVHPPTIEELAHRCATNASKLKRAFKHTYQTTIYGYIQRLRMEEANLLLREESLSIGEVARRVGYRHQGHFSRLFYHTYGLYPKTLK